MSIIPISNMIRFISPIFSLFVLSSCSVFFPKDDISMPYSEYEILGTVVDSVTGEPVSGVSVTLFEAAMSEDGKNMEVGSKIDSLEVSLDGTFDLSGRSYRGLNDFKFIRVTDLDLTMDGSYAPEMFEVKLQFDAEPPANAHMSEGSFANRDVLLKVGRQ